MIKEWKQKDWLRKRNELEDRISKFHSMEFATVKRYDDRILIEKGSILMGFGDDGHIFIWGRGSRHSGNRVYLDELIAIRDVIHGWIEDQKKEAII